MRAQNFAVIIWLLSSSKNGRFLTQHFAFLTKKNNRLKCDCSSISMTPLDAETNYALYSSDIMNNVNKTAVTDHIKKDLAQ